MHRGSTQNARRFGTKIRRPEKAQERINWSSQVVNCRAILGIENQSVAHRCRVQFEPQKQLHPLTNHHKQAGNS